MAAVDLACATEFDSRGLGRRLQTFALRFHRVICKAGPSVVPTAGEQHVETTAIVPNRSCIDRQHDTFLRAFLRMQHGHANDDVRRMARPQLCRGTDEELGRFRRPVEPNKPPYARRRIRVFPIDPWRSRNAFVHPVSW